MTEPLGLSTNEESLYLLLLDSPSLTLSELASLHPEITEDGVAVLLARLRTHGLVSLLPGTPGRYAAIDPRVGLKGLIAAQEQRLQHAEAAARQLAARFDAARYGRNPLDVIEVAVGGQHISDQFEQMQRTATQEIMGLDRPPYVNDDFNEDEVRHLSRGVRYRTVYDVACLDSPGLLGEIRDLQRAGEQARFLPGVPMKLVIADRELALLALTGGAELEPSCLLVRPSVLLDGLIQAFETLWALADDLPVPSAEALRTDARQPADPLTAPERELLALIGLGLTDAAAAHQLGVSERTVQRVMSGLMVRLSARTRFQAALRAKDRGWM